MNANWERDVTSKKADWDRDVSALKSKWDGFQKDIKTKWERFLEGEQNRYYDKKVELHDEIFARLEYQSQIIRSQKFEISGLTEKLKASEGLASQQQHRIATFDQLAQNLTSTWDKKS